MLLAAVMSICSLIHFVVFLFTGIAGYVAANMYKKMGGENWVWNINLTSALFARMNFPLF
jgi:hypothetical protein